MGLQIFTSSQNKIKFSCFFFVFFDENGRKINLEKDTDTIVIIIISW